MRAVEYIDSCKCIGEHQRRLLRQLYAAVNETAELDCEQRAFVKKAIRAAHLSVKRASAGSRIVVLMDKAISLAAYINTCK